MATGLDPKTNIWIPSTIELATDNGKNGMIYRASANISDKAKHFGDRLKTLIDDAKLEVDNPIVLAEITSMSGNYNMARQLQSSLMKSIKDTDQAIIRNM